MDPAALNGKTFAIVLVDEKEQGTTYYGTARWDGTLLILDRGPGNPPFRVREEWYEQIQRVTSPVVKAVLNNAEYWIKLSAGQEADEGTGS